ncbi:MAG: LytR C-terminal domain-containing protein [Mycobacteriaceae bacterium]|nr:LytR C-terminal domain-containing protein [Mycobacteriaceae bacterium]MBV9513838.1 LytR C-terminal domain-containing protein [Mycobacteriaceae bacterium]
MNQRVPDSGGLPLRAMVMVLLFFGIVFLLLGINAVRTSGSGNQATPVVNTTTAATSPSPAAPKPDVHVYNISGVEGAAARAAARLTQAGWNATVEPGTLDAPDVTATTVFFTEAPGERDAAGEVAKILDNAPVESRRPELADLPAGLIVTVTG